MELLTKVLIRTFFVSGLLGTSACSMTDNTPKTDQSNEISQTINEDHAKEIALNRVSGTITEADLEKMNNQLVYDIEISTVYKREAKITVDAINGEILKVEE